MMSRRVVSSVAALLACLFVALPAAGQQCEVPGSPAIIYSPSAAVGVGQTYSIVWKDAGGLDSEGYYLVERSTNSAFVPLLDSQLSYSTNASFTIDSSVVAAALHHRVRAVSACDPQNPGPWSPTAVVPISSGAASVVFSVQPKPILVDLGSPPQSGRSFFVLENLTKRTVTVALSTAELPGSTPFFRLLDLPGEDRNNLELQPGQPKKVEIEVLSSVPTGQRASFQGLVLVTALGEPLAVTPYAFVNVKIGVSEAAPPYFSSGGIPVEYAFFPGFANVPEAPDHDRARSPIEVRLHNPGGTPLEVAAEVGPEVWLVPPQGWNTNPIPAGGSIPIRLTTRRAQAPNNSALPRYTYFTVRSRGGQSARLLVQDNDAASLSAGRQPLASTARSLIVPDVVTSVRPDGRPSYSRVRLSNSSSERIQVELFFTPSGAGGFDASLVRRAVVVVPKNDVVTLNDPLLQIFGLSPPSRGQIEIRAAEEAIVSLTVSSSVFAPIDSGGGFGFPVPVAMRGEGAALGNPFMVPGITSTAGLVTDAIVAETSGASVPVVSLTLRNNRGEVVGAVERSVGPYGHLTIDDVVATLAGGEIFGGRFEVDVKEGKGRLLPLALVRDSSNSTGTILIGQAGAGAVTAKAFRLSPISRRDKADANLAFVVPTILRGQQPNSGIDYRTLLGLVASPTRETQFTLTLSSAASEVLGVRTITVRAGESVEIPDLVGDTFGIVTSLRGLLTVSVGDERARIYARLTTARAGSAMLAGALPVIPTISPGLTGGGSSQRPVYVDGAEQTTDSSRGTTWSLVLSEIGGAAVVVTVRLYEAANRVLPIAERNVSLTAREQKVLTSVFSELGLDSDERRKDRTNVLVVVHAKSGEGLVAAIAMQVDNRTGDTQVFQLTPSGGIPASGNHLAARPKVVPPPVLKPLPPDDRNPVRIN